MLTSKQARLFEFLRKSEVSKANFTAEEAAGYTGYAVSTIHTYLSKKLTRKWVSERSGFFSVQGIRGASEVEFSNVMTQTLSPKIQGYSEWREQLHSIVVEGVGSNYPVSDTLLEIAASIDDPQQNGSSS